MAVQEVGLLVADQLRVTVPPVVTAAAEEVRVTTGFWRVLTVMITEAVSEVPPRLVQFRV